MEEPLRRFTDTLLHWSRRSFLQVAGGAAATVALLAARADLVVRGHDRVGAAPQLTARELERIAAVALVLFPAATERERALVERTARWWAAGRSSRGAHLPLYRAGLAALDAAGRDAAFDELTPAARHDLVAGLMTAGDDAPFRRFAAELIEGLYASAPGWTLVGYRTWPGVPGPPREHTRKPHRSA